MNATTQHLESLGHLTASLQVPYSRIAKAVEVLKLKPTLTLNGVAHFGDAECEAIAAHVLNSPPQNKKTTGLSPR
jgi:hypothetical protein